VWQKRLFSYWFIFIFAAFIVNVLSSDPDVIDLDEQPAFPIICSYGILHLSFKVVTAKIINQLVVWSPPSRVLAPRALDHVYLTASPALWQCLGKGSG
jgi:hypothetical protein